MTIAELRPHQALAPHTAPPREPERQAPVSLVRDDSPAAPASIRVPSPRARGTGFTRYRYEISDGVSVASDVALPELDFFRVGRLDSPPAIEVKRGHVGHRTPRSRAVMTQFDAPAALRYEEHLGALGANFSLDLGDPIKVTVSPLLARSPHVLYTNVLEALLRFVFVSRGQMLLHSACLELDGVGVMLSARTDTGKTGTILRLLRERRARFLSDDMTILDGTGLARTYPKPLTISAHTLRAVDPGDVGRLEWAVLNLKGRLHSKGGRSVGMEMGEHNLPIMSANSLVQALVPPPKYPVERLVRCELADSVPVTELFIIERGAPRLSEVTRDEALGELLENTDDAYGFPPFRYFAPCLVIGGEQYEQLRAREAEILESALSNVRVRRLASDSFGWADTIPDLVASSRHNGSVVHGAQVLDSRVGA